MQSLPLLDCAGRRRSPATTSSFHQGLPPRNKGRRYAPEAPTVEAIIAVMRAAGDRPDGVRLRGVIVILWRAGLRISEALSLNETDLDADRGAVLVRHGKGEKRREVGMDRWAWGGLCAAHYERWRHTSSRGSRCAESCPPVRCSALCGAAHAVGRARPPRSALSSIAPLRRLVFAVASRRTSCATRTRSRCPARESR